jgi:dihydroceramidase
LVLIYIVSERDATNQYPLLPLGLVLYGALFTYVYTTIRIPEFFLITFALQVMYAVYTAFTNMILLTDSPYKTQMVSLFKFGVGLYGTASLVWLVDNELCHTLRGIRTTLQTGPTSWLHVLFQFHAWWHVLSGIACYCLMLCAEMWRLAVLKEHHNLTLQWKGGVFPVLATRHPKEAL